MGRMLYTEAMMEGCRKREGLSFFLKEEIKEEE